MIHKIITYDIYVFTIEGLDCSGKETASKAVRDYLVTKYPENNVILLSFPEYNNTTGKLIYKYLRQPIKDNSYLADLFSRNRHEVLEGLELCPKQPNIIICDRYYHSNAFYQTLNFGKRELDVYLYDLTDKEINVYNNYPVDIMFFLNTPFETIKERLMMKKAKDMYEDLPHVAEIYTHVPDVLNAIYDSSQNMIKYNTYDYTKGDIKSPEEIGRDIGEEIISYMNNDGGIC